MVHAPQMLSASSTMGNTSRSDYSVFSTGLWIIFYERHPSHPHARYSLCAWRWTRLDRHSVFFGGVVGTTTRVRVWSHYGRPWTFRCNPPSYLGMATATLRLPDYATGLRSQLCCSELSHSVLLQATTPAITSQSPLQVRFVVLDMFEILDPAVM